MPVSFSEENSARMVSKILEIKALAKKPFLLENISYYWSMPGDDMTEAHFLRSIVEKADCGLLLDVANLYTNAINHGYDALTFLDDIPMERVVEIHLAGSDRRFDMLVDTHSTAYQ